MPTRISRLTRRAITAAACILLTTMAGCSRPDERPSILLVTIDTLRADHLGCYGYERAQTPNLDRLAAGSVVFERTTTPSNNTLPAHASILTGRYPHSIGVPRNSFPLPEDETTIAQILGESGYETAAFVGASVLSSRLGIERGFALFDEEFPLQEMDHAQRRADTTTDAALRWIEQQEEGPFFLWVHYFDPHYPYTPPPPYDSLYGSDYEGPADGSMEHLCTIWGLNTPKIEPTPMDVQRLIDLYDGEIAYLDAHLGRLFERFDAPDLSGSILAVTADHGESLDEHDYLFNHGSLVYEPSMRIPFLLQGPDISPDRIEAQVSSMDILPTLLSMLGMPTPENVEGKDLLPLIEGTSDRVHDYVFGEACRPWEVEKRYPRKYRNLYKAQTAIAYPWKLIQTPFAKTLELYNLEDDPGETVNVAKQNAPKVQELSRAISQWRHGDLAPVGEPDAQNLELLRSLGYTN